MNPQQAGFDGAKGIALNNPSIPGGGIYRLRRGATPPWEAVGNFKNSLVWYELTPPQLLYCNTSNEWFELLFIPIQVQQFCTLRGPAMTQEHQITPPEEVIDEWEGEWHHYKGKDTYDVFMATQAARWGANQELEACCSWLIAHYWKAASEQLRAVRRPKPPSLKEQALQALYRFDDTEGHDGLTQEQIAEDFVLIRRALESLPE